MGHAELARLDKVKREYETKRRESLKILQRFEKAQREKLEHDREMKRLESEWHALIQGQMVFSLTG